MRGVRNGDGTGRWLTQRDMKEDVRWGGEKVVVEWEDLMNGGEKNEAVGEGR